MIVSLEAIFLSTFVMIGQNRAGEKRQSWPATREVLREAESDPGATARHPRRGLIEPDDHAPARPAANITNVDRKRPPAT